MLRTHFLTACSFTLCVFVLFRNPSPLFPPPTPPSPYQSIFMFPLSFSSSSSLSSIPPSLDSVSEFERHLSDISEDDDLAADAPPLSASSPFADQHPADLDHLALSPPTPSRAHGVEPSVGEESLRAVTTAGTPPYWRRVYLKCLSLALCFLLSLGKSGNRPPSNDLLSRLSNRLGSFSAAVQQISSASARKLKILSTRAAKFSLPAPEFNTILAALWVKWTNFMAFLKAHQFTRRIVLLLAPPGHQQTQNWSLSYLLDSPQVSSLPSGLRSLPLCFARRVSPSLRCYLSEPSPLFLPCLLVIFLLAVMLTASQSLALALVLATPLGLTLCCLESIVSTQRRSPVLPLFAPESEELSGSGLGSLTPPRVRHLTSAGWTQEMCDPAA